jgi:peptide/nickel transport system substrate-binding protein
MSTELSKIILLGDAVAPRPSQNAVRRTSVHVNDWRRSGNAVPAPFPAVPVRTDRPQEVCMEVQSLRRRLLGAAGIATIAALAACGSSNNSTSGNATDTPTAEPTQSGAVNGGTLNVGLVQEPTSFLAAGITDSMTFSYAVDAVTSEGLLWYKSVDETANAKSQADFWRPALATEVPSSANGDVKTSGCKDTSAKMCVTWKLRQGVKWQDGSTFSSKDVCATHKFFWLQYKEKNPTALLSTNGWDLVSSCDDTNPNEAVVNYTQVYGPYLTLGTGVYGIIPAKQLDAAFAANTDIEKTAQTVDLTVGSGNPSAFKGTDTLDKIIVGTGPYVLSKYEPTKEIDFVRNQNYWDKAHQPHLDQISFKIISGTAAELTAAKAGTIDFGLDYRLKFLQDLITESGNGKIKVETLPESGAEKIDLNMCDNAKGLCGATAKKSPYMADKTIRHAMLAGINRQQIIDTLAAGKTVVPQDSWIYLGSEFIKTTDVPTTKYDPAAANKMLDDAGYKLSPSCDGGKTRAFKDGSCINVDLATTSGNKAREDAEPLIAADLQNIGIHINTPYKNVTSGKLFGSFADGGVLYTHTFDMAMYTNTLSAPAEPDSWNAGYHADCGGTCPTKVQIPSAANKGQGQDTTGEDNPQVDKLFDDAKNSIDLAKRASLYKQAEVLLAQDLPEIPLYQQVTVNSYSVKLQGLKRNDLVWTYNAYDWYCTAGNCQA